MIQRAELRSVKKLIQVGVDFVLIKELVISELLCTSNLCIFLFFFSLYISNHSHSLWTGISIVVQFSSVAQSCPTLCNPMNRSMPGLLVHHHLLEFTQTCVHRVSHAIQPSHPRSSPSPPAPNPSQHQSLFQWVNSSHEVAKVLEFQL